MQLSQLHRIKVWHVRHRMDRPVEYHLWDAMLMLWLVGWVGWVPALVTGAVWAAPLLIAAVLAPSLYVAWRMRAHKARRVRCDWLPVL